jgi:hypothetical protein
LFIEIGDGIVAVLIVTVLVVQVRVVDLVDGCCEQDINIGIIDTCVEEGISVGVEGFLALVTAAVTVLFVVQDEPIILRLILSSSLESRKVLCGIGTKVVLIL